MNDNGTVELVGWSVLVDAMAGVNNAIMLKIGGDDVGRWRWKSLCSYCCLLRLATYLYINPVSYRSLSSVATPVGDLSAGEDGWWADGVGVSRSME